MSNNVVPFQPTNAEVYRASTDAAGLCRDIVLKTAQDIQGRRYVKVEGWQAIAIAHGCVAGSGDVEVLDDGIRAIGEVRRMSDGQLIARAEGFVGKDEPTWYGGMMRKWKWGQQRGEKVWFEEEMPKRADYAIRAMAQTRAISRACRSAFAHVVVLIDAGLSTTPAEEMSFDQPAESAVIEQAPAPDHPNAPPREPAQAARPTPRRTAAPAQERPPTASQRGPQPTRPVDRTGVTIPAPLSDGQADWRRWFRAVSRRIEQAPGREEVDRITHGHADDVKRGDQIVEGAATSLRELVAARIIELSAKVA